MCPNGSDMFMSLTERTPLSHYRISAVIDNGASWREETPCVKRISSRYVLEWQWLRYVYVLNSIRVGDNPPVCGVPGCL